MADRAITQLHDLVEDISTERVQVANREYARNALQLLRDALLDLNALHVLVHDLIAKQGASSTSRSRSGSFTAQTMLRITETPRRSVPSSVRAISMRSAF